MSGDFSLKEAAAIAELPERIVRAALNRKVVTPRYRSVGKALRYRFAARELLYLKFLSDFPFDLSDNDKCSLCKLIFQRAKAAGRWHAEGSDFVLQNGDLVLHVEVKPLRDHIIRNLASYRRGRRRIVSSPDILGGEPVFAGTRIPLAHVVGMIRNGVDAAEILEDYPSLTAPDLAYAAICARMKPDPGRPRKPLELRRREPDRPAIRHAAADR